MTVPPAWRVIAVEAWTVVVIIIERSTVEASRCQRCGDGGIVFEALCPSPSSDGKENPEEDGRCC